MRLSISFAERRARALELLADLADRGAPCPSNADLAARIGLNSGTQASRVLDELQLRGLISIRLRSNRRSITVLATGKSTADIGEPPATGEILAERVREAARAAGVSVREFAEPLSSDPLGYLDQLSRARQPKHHTVERIRLLLAGEPVPPPPPNSFQRRRAASEIAEEVAEMARRRAAARSIGSVRTSLAALERAEPRPTYVTTEPCGCCGARDGTACGCTRRSTPPIAASQPGVALPPRPKGRPRTFEEQLAAVAAGAGLIEVAPLRGPTPLQTLGGVGSSML